MPLILEILLMHLFFGTFIFMLASSLLMVGYVVIRDIKNKRSQPVQISDAGKSFFEEVQPAETTLTKYPDLRQKTA